MYTLFDQLVRGVVKDNRFPHPLDLHEACLADSCVLYVDPPKTELQPNKGGSSTSVTVNHDAFANFCALAAAPPEVPHVCIPNVGTQRVDVATNELQLKEGQVQLMNECLAALSDSEESMLTWYLEEYE